MTLEEAQLAKIDLSLGKLGLEPGMTLLDIGCGWGAAMMRAVERYDVNVVGLTLSENQRDHLEKAFAAIDSPRSRRVLLAGWEQFDEPVDRIVSIGAFEHFGQDRHEDFFSMAFRCLPENGVMLLHTITRLTLAELKEKDIPLTMDAARFASFISKEIFPGGHLPTIEAVQTQAAAAGLTLTRTQSLQTDYARTLDIWAQELAANRDEAIITQSEEVYLRYMKYLTGCADMFKRRYIDINQFTLAK